MSRSKKHLPEKPFEQLGFVAQQESGTQVIGECAFCNGSEKMYINRNNLLWDCKSCGRDGNLEGFLEQITTSLRNRATNKTLKKLADDRGLSITTLKAWGVGWSGAFFSIPMRGNVRGRIVNVKRCRIGGRGLTTVGCKLNMLRASQLYDSDTVWLCEGEWDAMSMWELLHSCGIEQDVYAMPGANTFPQDCTALFEGKRVNVVYDNDEPGKKGTVRVFKRLTGVAKDLRFVHWPAGTPADFDLRDYYTQNGGSAATLLNVENMLMHAPTGDIDTDKEAQAVLESQKMYGPVQYTGAGMPADAVYAAFQKWLVLPDTEVLDILFGTVFANRISGEPLWLLLVAPPGGTKTALIRTLAGAPGIVEASSLTRASLISGFNGPGGKDPSLIPKLNGRVLVIKDFTTILSKDSTEKEEIFGILRDAYDGYCEKHLGNGVHRKYHSKFGIIAGVTPAIEKEGAQGTMLGERFIRCRLTRTSTRDSREHEIILRAIRSLGRDDIMDTELRAAAAACIDVDTANRPLADLPPEIEQRIVELATWISHLRGVVPRDQYTGVVHYTPMTEHPTRLAKQLTKLAYGISVFKNHDVVQECTFQALCRVAVGTIPDRVERVASAIFLHSRRKKHSSAFTITALVNITDFPRKTIQYVLEDMELLGMVVREGASWKLSLHMYTTIEGIGIYAKEKAEMQSKQRNTVHAIPRRKPARARLRKL